jgi:hypothetical protein
VAQQQREEDGAEAGSQERGEEVTEVEANTMCIAVRAALGFRWADLPSDSWSKAGNSSWCDPRIT